MPDRDQSQDFIQQLATQIHRFDVEHERMERLHGILAVGMIKVQRLSQALTAEIEQMKSQMAGITPLGFEPLPPQAPPSE